MTPYEKLKSLPNVESFLKPDVTIEALDKLAAEKTDLEELLYKKRNALFSKITGF
jgi:hypothetical protein